MTDPAPLELRALGGLDLRLRGVELRPILAQPKRLSLFLYLALSRPGEFLRRDTLLGLFWPESSDGAARASLRQAIRFLRKAVGDDLLLNRGDEEIGFASGALDGDVMRFRACLEAGDDSGALACYGGELLPGLHPSGSPDLEQWLDWERQRYRQQALQAALRLADLAEAAGDPAALDWSRRAVELDPSDEAVTSRLMRLLDGAGNRGAAIAAYENLARRLHEIFDVEPSPETARLAAELRARAGTGTAPEVTPAAVRQEGHANVQPRRILVAVFDNATGDPALDVLGRMTADWLAQRLAQVPELEVVPPMATLGSASRGAADSLAASQALASETGAGTIVAGTFYAEGHRIRFHARVIDAVNGRLLRSPEPIAGAAEEPMEALAALSEQVTAILAPLLTPRSVHVQQGAPPPNYPAYRAYMEGLECFIGGDWGGALPHFQRSAAAGPGYALPRLVSAIAHWNLGQLELALAAARDAERTCPAMSRFEREILKMIQAWLAGDWVASHEAVSAQAELAPGSIPQFGVAQDARRLNRPAEAVAVLGRMAPERGELRGWFFYWLELTTSLHLVGDHAGELETAERASGHYPNHPGVALLMVRALAALGRMDELEQLLDAAITSPRLTEPRAGQLLREAGLELNAHGHAEAAAGFFRRALAWWRGQPGVASGPARERRELARACYHAGEWAESAELFRNLVGAEEDPAARFVIFEHGYLQGQLAEGYLAVIAIRQDDAAGAAHWCRVLEEMRRPFTYGGQWLWLAAVAALRGEKEVAVEQLRRAFAAGLPMELWVHQELHLQMLKGYRPYDALMRGR